ncbi:hypothetical protein EG328_005126 [Venturia inaequalis]|uniref:Uncharacterized protein n=1 Tax=Venturia inaequalis TaxID=5025 RepID=A0A8H3UMB6_VENIN|nr:hypothetical protein EG328_005126 [Venturia inaequalis]
MSRPVSKTYGNQELKPKTPKKWRTKVMSFLAAKRKKKDGEDEKSLGDKEKPLPKTPPTLSSTSFIIIGVEEAIERDGRLFTPPHASSSSLVVHVGKDFLDGDSAEACTRGGTYCVEAIKGTRGLGPFQAC